MSQDAYYRIAAAVLMFTALGIRIFHQRRADRDHGKLERRADGAAVVTLLILTAVPGYLSVLLYLINPAWMAWSTVPLPAPLRWAGAAIAIAMLPLLFWMFQSLGKNLTPTSATRTTQTLVTDGPYRWIRHPLYTFGGAFWLGECLLCAQWFAALMLAAGMAVLVHRTTREEENLTETFGQQYRDYMNRTGRFFPRLFHTTPAATSKL